jgi:DNA ligase-1
MKPWNVIQKLEVTSSTLAKEAILAEAIVNCPEFFGGARLAYDSMITFGVKKVPHANGGKGIMMAEFAAVAQGLVNRKLTGHAARDAIQTLADKATIEQWDGWYRRILLKDFKAGVTDTLVNKAANVAGRKDLVIPTFTCQLAHSAVDADGVLDDDLVAGEKMIDVKMDGTRCLAVCMPSGKVTLYSRNGKEWMNFGHIAEELKAVAIKVELPIVFDGEVMSATFQDLMKQARRKSNVQADDAILNLFDAIPLKDFLAGKCDMPQRERRFMLEGMFQGEDLPHVNVLGWEQIDLDTSDGQARFQSINKHALAGGYEGIMLKDPTAPYRCKRSKDWLKIKPFIEVTLQVVGLEEGKPGTKNVGKLGALVCAGTDEGKYIEVNVGGGLSDAQRDDFWKNHVSVIGSLVEVRADAITKSQSGDIYSLRFPRFKCFRGTKKGEKV